MPTVYILIFEFKLLALSFMNELFARTSRSSLLVRRSVDPLTQDSVAFAIVGRLRAERHVLRGRM